MNDKINYYDLLGISKTASPEEIKSKYRELAKKWHPDINKSDDAPEMIKKLNDAKETLLDEDKRKEYDEFLNTRKNPAYENLRNNNYKKEKHEEKMYTKWEFLREYLKYYKTSKIKKFFVLILVLLESLFCSILQIINYILALVLAYGGSIISYLIKIFITVMIIVFIISYLNGNSILPNSFTGWLSFIFTSILCILMTFLPEFIAKILYIKMPSILEKLNIFLFKKCVGYEKI